MGLSGPGGPGFDLDKMLGLGNAEYKTPANMLGVDYAIYGVVTIKKGGGSKGRQAAPQTQCSSCVALQ